MIKIAVCENEMPQNNYLCKVIGTYFKKNTIEYKLYSFDNGMDLLRERVFYNLIFLDICMPGIDGIDLARKIRERNKKAKIIYITGYAEYFQHAFGVHAFSYLLKPVGEVELHTRIGEALEYFKAEAEKPVFSLKTLEGTIHVCPDEIYYFEFWQRKIKIVAKGGEYLMEGTMYQLLERLEKHDFSSPHKSFIVNFYHIRRISGYDIRLSNDMVVPLAQKRAVLFKGAYNDYLQKSLGWSE